MRNWSRKEYRLRYRQELSERDRSAESLIKNRWLFAKLSEQIVAYQNDSEKLDKFRCEIHYRDRSNAFNAAYQYYIYAEDKKKAGSGIGKVCFSALAGVYVSSFNEDKEIFFEVGSWWCFVHTTDNPVIIGMTDEGLNYARSWGCVKHYNVFDAPTKSKAEYKIFINQTD